MKIQDIQKNLIWFYIDSGHFEQVGWPRNNAESQVFQKRLFSAKIAFRRSPDSEARPQGAKKTSSRAKNALKSTFLWQNWLKLSEDGATGLNYIFKYLPGPISRLNKWNINNNNSTHLGKNKVLMISLYFVLAHGGGSLWTLDRPAWAADIMNPSELGCKTYIPR